jgi:hypothetical protein
MLGRGRTGRKISYRSRPGTRIGMELVVKAHFNGFTVREIPTVWRDRAAGKSSFKLMKWLPNYMRWYSYALLHRANSLL